VAAIREAVSDAGEAADELGALSFLGYRAYVGRALAAPRHAAVTKLKRIALQIYVKHKPTPEAEAKLDA
jgi:hypothetical protein